MAIRNTIVLTDAATTPVNRSYFPVTQKENVLVWHDRTQAIAVGQNVLSLAQKVPSANSPTYKMSWKLELPVLAQTSPSTGTGIQPAPSVAYKNLVSIDLVMHERSTLQERKDALAQVRDLIDEAIVTAQIENFDLIW